MTDAHILTFARIILFLVALFNSYKLFKVHRAPALGFFLLSCATGLSVLLPASPQSKPVVQDVQWAAEVLGPAMVAFGFLWLSDDHSTAYVLLVISTLLCTFTDWLSADGLAVMTRCLAMSALSCSLTVCLFAGNKLGMLGSVALSLPALVGLDSAGPLVSPEAAGGLLKTLLTTTSSLGCWASRHGLELYLLDLKGWERNNVLG